MFSIYNVMKDYSIKNIIKNQLFAFTRLMLVCLSMYLFVACQKVGPYTVTTTVSGKLTAANSNRVLANAKINLVKVVAVGHTLKDRILDSTRSDALGHYSFTFDESSGEAYNGFQIVCYYPDYYSTRDLTGPFPTGRHFELGGVQVYNPELHPYAWVKIKCELDNSVTLLSVNKTFGEYLSPSVSNPGNEEFILKTKGNYWNVITSFLYYNDGRREILQDSIYCGNNDTTTLIIKN